MIITGDNLDESGLVVQIAGSIDFVHEIRGISGVEG
jgi:hypothetical protein